METNKVDKLNKSWTHTLFDWADFHEIPDLAWFEDSDDDMPSSGFWHGFPRTEKALLSMTELNLDWHDLTELPEELGNLKQLTTLSVNKCPSGWQVRPEPKTLNKLSSIPEWVCGLSNLRHLYFEGNAITEIPSDIGALKHLEQLWLPENSISAIPDSISQCSKLTCISLRNNKIRIITESLFECIKLEFLSLEANKIERVPQGLSKLKSLSTLELARNKLTACPEEINLLEKLTYLTLLLNKFIELPIGPLNLKNMECFDMLNFEYSVARNYGHPVLH
jgi:Leucine-rich repeat (LRR) protein